MRDQRSRLIYSRARHLFRTELPGVGWPGSDQPCDPEYVRLSASYLCRAERELSAEGLLGFLAVGAG